MNSPTLGKKRSKTNTVYIPREMREELESLSIEISYKLNRHINPSELIQFIYAQYGRKAVKTLLERKED